MWCFYVQPEHKRLNGYAIFLPGLRCWLLLLFKESNKLYLEPMYICSKNYNLTVNNNQWQIYYNLLKCSIVLVCTFESLEYFCVFCHFMLPLHYIYSISYKLLCRFRLFSAERLLLRDCCIRAKIVHFYICKFYQQSGTKTLISKKKKKKNWKVLSILKRELHTWQLQASLILIKMGGVGSTQNWRTALPPRRGRNNKSEISRLIH